MELTAYFRVIMALLLVIGLMFGLLWALRRFNIGGMVARPGVRRRLAVVETSAIDARRRLVLVRRDGVEHLLLIGGTRDLVVESGIKGFEAALLSAAAEGEEKAE